VLLFPPSTSVCGTSGDPAQLVQAQVDAHNAHDIDAFASCDANSVTLTDLSGNAHDHGYAGAQA